MYEFGCNWSDYIYYVQRAAFRPGQHAGRDGQFVKQFMKINIIVFQTHDPIMFVMQPKLGYIMGAHIVNIVLSVDNNILLHCNFPMGGGGGRAGNALRW